MVVLTIIGNGFHLKESEIKVWIKALMKMEEKIIPLGVGTNSDLDWL